MDAHPCACAVYVVGRGVCPRRVPRGVCSGVCAQGHSVCCTCTSPSPPHPVPGPGPGQLRVVWTHWPGLSALSAPCGCWVTAFPHPSQWEWGGAVGEAEKLRGGAREHVLGGEVATQGVF